MKKSFEISKKYYHNKFNIISSNYKRNKLLF